MTSVALNLQHVKDRMIHAAQQCGRDPAGITLLAVSKTKPESAIETAWQNGQLSFGENYVQEGVAKIHQLKHLQGICWHFIGPLQSNKSRLVAENFDWCHTLDRLKLAERLSHQRPASLAPLNVLIQVNISHQPGKAGIAPAGLKLLAQQISALPNLALRGLMAVPAPGTDYQKQLAVFQQMAALYQGLTTDYPCADTLSLGMSDDLEAAIAAGSTLIRIGSAIFGARHYPTT